MTWEVEDGIHFTGDRTLLSRLIANLVGNAYRYGRENGHTQVTLNREEEHILLSVADDGIGMPRTSRKKFSGGSIRGLLTETARAWGWGFPWPGRSHGCTAGRLP